MHYAASSISSSYSATQRNSWGTLRGSTSRSCVTGKCSWGTLDRSTARSRAKHRECSWGTLRGSTPRSCASHRDGIDCYQIFIAKLVAWVAAKSSSSEEDTHTTWVATQSSPSQREHPDLCHLGLARVPVRPRNIVHVVELCPIPVFNLAVSQMTTRVHPQREVSIFPRRAEAPRTRDLQRTSSISSFLVGQSKYHVSTVRVFYSL